MCLVETRSKKPRLKSRKGLWPTVAPISSIEEAPRLHINSNGTSGISFPTASISKIPSHLRISPNPTRAPTIPQSPSGTQLASTATPPKQQIENKDSMSLSTIISVQGNEIVKGAEELHRLASQLEDVAGSSPRTTRQPCRSRSTDRSSSSDGNRLHRERELEQEFQRKLEYIREWKKERDEDWGWDRDTLAMKALKREKSNTEKIKEIERERKMEKAIAAEVKSRILEESISQIRSSCPYGYGHAPVMYSHVNPAGGWNALPWGSAVDDEAVTVRNVMHNREGEPRIRRRSVVEMALDVARGFGVGRGNGNSGRRGSRHPRDGGEGGGGDVHLHHHRHNHRYLYYDDLSSTSHDVEHEYGNSRASDRERARRKSSAVSVISVIGVDYVRRFLEGWPSGESLVSGMKDGGKGGERDGEGDRGRGRARERNWDRYGERSRKRDYGYGYAFAERAGTARRRGVEFDL